MEDYLVRINTGWSYKWIKDDGREEIVGDWPDANCMDCGHMLKDVKMGCKDCRICPSCGNEFEIVVKEGMYMIRRARFYFSKRER